MSVPVFVTALFCLLVVNALDNKLDLEEGDECKNDNGRIWTCKQLPECPTAIQLLQNYLHPEMCSFKGNDLNQLSNHIVCCEPSSSVGRQAKQMCEEYNDKEYETIGNSTARGVHKVSLGENSKPGEFPHMVLIEFNNTGFPDDFCGGSLISDRFVLSAAHCSYTVKGKPRWARLGDIDISKNESLTTVKYEIIQSFQHPEYNHPRVYNDIILHKLNTSVVFNTFIKPACLNTEYLFPDGSYTVTGWGISNWAGQPNPILQKANLPIHSREACKNDYEKVSNDEIKDGIKDELMFCAGSNGKDTCSGDSGGPLQVRIPGHNNLSLVLGITSSSGSICGAGYHYGVYVRVSHYISWIENIVWPN